MGPFKVLACPSPNTYCLENPATWRACDELQFELLRPYHRRPNGLCGAPGPPPSPPFPGADGGPEFEVQELLKFKMRWGQPYILVRWSGCDASRDIWEPLVRRRTTLPTVRRPLPHSSGLGPPIASTCPAGCCRPALAYPAGTSMLRRLAISASHASACAASARTWSPTQTSALRGTADTLLDAASYGQRWVLLSPAPAAGVDRAADASPIASRTRRQDPPALTFRLVTVGGSSRVVYIQAVTVTVTAGPGPGRAGPGRASNCVFIGNTGRVATALVYIAELGAR